MLPKISPVIRSIAVIVVLSWCSLWVTGQKPEQKDSLKLSYTTVKIPMDDGILLGTDIYLPGKHGTYPVVLVRTPYNKRADQWMGKAFNLFGIAVVIQDVRGRYTSEGDFYPFIHERSDGLRTLRWIRGQAWSDGTIAGWGASYVGYTQWAVSDSLDYLTLLLTGANLYDFTYPDGLFSLQSAFVWGFQNAASVSKSLPPEKLIAASKILPLSAADDSTVQDMPFITDWINHETYDDYWKQMDFRGITKAPLISMAGWYDIFLKAQINDFEALTDNGNQASRLIIGPWCHGEQAEKNEYGGIKKTGSPKAIFRYVRKELKGKKNKLKSPFEDTKYNLFIMERNEYVGSDVWPPRETDITPYYIGSGRYLGTDPFPENGRLHYEYAPEDPYPSHGGTILGDGAGSAKQNSNVDRKDQLVFELEEQLEPLILLGPISAKLWLSSTAPNTDFIVGLEDVFPDGKIINIQEGGAHVKLDPGTPEKADISVWATGYQVNPGHRLRVIITSSWFPRFNRNLNNGEPAAEATNPVHASQEVSFGPDTPSCINLPIYKLSEKE